MTGSSSAVLLGADRLLAGGPVLGNDTIEEFVAEIAEALAAAEVPVPDSLEPDVPAPATLEDVRPGTA